MRTKYVGWRLRMTIILRDRACRRCGKPVAYTTGAGVRGNACWRAYDAKGGSFHFDHIRGLFLGEGRPQPTIFSCYAQNATYLRGIRLDFPPVYYLNGSLGKEAKAWQQDRAAMRNCSKNLASAIDELLKNQYS